VTDLKRIIEAILFAVPRPVTRKQLQKKLEPYPVGEIDKALKDLINEYAYSERAIEIAHVSGGYQMRTRYHFREWVRKFVRSKDVILTQAMMEVLAIAAYRQPVPKSEMDRIRGVDCSRTIRQLLERRLIEPAGRGADGGSELLFRTTQKFLEVYNLNDISDLPTFREIETLDR